MGELGTRAIVASVCICRRTAAAARLARHDSTSGMTLSKQAFCIKTAQAQRAPLLRREAGPIAPAVSEIDLGDSAPTSASRNVTSRRSVWRRGMAYKWHFGGDWGGGKISVGISSRLVIKAVRAVGVALIEPNEGMAGIAA